MFNDHGKLTVGGEAREVEWENGTAYGGRHMEEGKARLAGWLA